MNITINIIEVASELAEKDLKRAFVECGYEVFPNGIIEDQDGIDVYTKEAQDMFNERYDYWFDFLLDQNIEDEK